MTHRHYQTTLVAKCIELFQTHNEVCLAACTGAGKTIMASQIAEAFLKLRPNARILISAHGQQNLRRQIVK